MITIGTAGHIDHGKSSIVKHLTGTDPDRLPEEKARGMTIDLGFAFYNTQSGEQIALVDVPGHERFVKNMIAGAGGIDAVMLVIAADDGWMPQSQEHFQVVRLLGVHHGMIVINKIDLVEPDWLELLQSEIKEKVKGSFLADAPVFIVSSHTGEGFDELKQHLETLPTKLTARRDIGKARLYIDRSFVRPGIGGVVTGTLKGGSLSVGQSVTIWPSLKTGKIRSLQSGNTDVESAQPGQRTAVSLTGIDKEFLKRGGVVSGRAKLSYLSDNNILALSVEMLSEAPTSLTDRREVLLIVGTTEVTGELRLYHSDRLKAGETGIVFFKPTDPVYSLVGDHFIVRLPTPMVTLGGGRIIDHLDSFPRRKHFDRYSYLDQRVTGDLRQLLISEISKLILAPSDNLLEYANYSDGEVSAAIEELKKNKEVKAFKGHLYCHDVIDYQSKKLTGLISSFLEGKTHLRGLLPDELIRLSQLPEKTSLVLIELLAFNGILVKTGDRYNLSGRDTKLKGAVKKAFDEIMAELESDQFTPPTLATLAGKSKNHKEAIGYIIDSGQGYKCGKEFIFLLSVWEQIIRFIKEQLDQNEEVVVADLRDKFEHSRKFVIPIFEETDRIGLTMRDGDKRIKGARFADQEFDI